MEGQAFTVLPPLSPRVPPPPPTPASNRIAPRAVAHREASAFVILGEIKIPDGSAGAANSGAAASGRVSPFRGSGFRAPSPPSKIPVAAGKSAPTSPVRKTGNKLTTTNAKPAGKSAPTTPKKTSNNINNRTTARKRGESPSKVPQSKVSTVPTVKEPNNNKRVTAKPPVPKSPRRSGIANGTNNGVTLKPPQPVKRSTGDSKPAPAARTRLNNKPVSTEVKAGSVTKDRFSNNNPPKPAARKTLGKTTENDSNVRKSRRDIKATEVNNNNNDTKEEEMNKKNADEGMKSTLVNVGDEDILNKVVTVTETVPEIHKLNIEINQPGGDEGPDSITVVELITPDEDIDLMPSPKTPLVHMESPSPQRLSPKSALEVNGSLPVEAKVVDETKTGSPNVEKIRNGMTVLRAVKGSAGSGVGSRVGSVAGQDASEDVVEETKSTVEEPPEVESEAGIHTVTFSSPEIHPVSPRVPPKKKGNLRDRLRERMCGCCRPGSGKLSGSDAAADKKKEAQGPPQKWYSKLCKWKKEPPPPRLAKPMKAKGESFMSKLNCCKRKGKMTTTRKPPPTSSGPSCWRKLFCLDRACCAKCCARKTAPSEPPQGASRMEMKRSSSVPAPPKPTGLPKLDAALVEHASVMKGAIPVLPICLAWMCLILNILIPGSGTIISGLLCMCFGKPRFSVNDSGVARLGSLCVNLIVGISQIFTILFCLVGWGWSIWWGVIMIKVARKHRRIKIAEKATAAAGAAAPAPATTNQNHDVERGGGGG
ncbi:hypothetical protein GE061_010235 [Apolygus lucorum]|uniref:Protein SPEC3 n=1 Tax=Apolygus lucorum TaxID=248454 RepID=A0A6A4K5V3_APOLU|nr:hypothetical protein GE061_010235 [Apolygus lucorum]